MTYLLYLFDSSNEACEVCKRLTKCWSSKIPLVVSSEFWKSVGKNSEKEGTNEGCQR